MWGIVSEFEKSGEGWSESYIAEGAIYFGVEVQGGFEAPL
jgi:hypothetical protein